MISLGWTLSCLSNKIKTGGGMGGYFLSFVLTPHLSPQIMCSHKWASRTGIFQPHVATVSGAAFAPTALRNSHRVTTLSLSYCKNCSESWLSFHMNLFGQGLRQGKGETGSHYAVLAELTLSVILLPLLPGAGITGVFHPK